MAILILVIILIIIINVNSKKEKKTEKLNQEIIMAFELKKELKARPKTKLEKKYNKNIYEVESEIEFRENSKTNIKTKIDNKPIKIIQAEADVKKKKSAYAIKKEEILKKLEKEEIKNLNEIPTSMHKNNEIMFLALDKGLIKSFIEVEDKYCRNSDFIAKAIEKNIDGMEFIEFEFINNKNLILKALDLNLIKDFYYIHSKLKNDKDIVLKAFEKNFITDFYEIGGKLRSKLKADKEFILEALEKDWLSEFDFLNEKLCRDNEVVLKAFEKNISIDFSKIGDELKNNKEIILKALEKNSIPFFDDIGNEVNKDLDIVTKAFDNGIVHYFGNVSNILKNDKSRVLIALDRDIIIYFDDISDELKNDKEIILKAFDKKIVNDFNNIGNKMKNNKEVVEKAFDKGILKFFGNVGDELRNNKTVVLDALDKGWIQYFNEIGENVKFDRNIILKAIEMDLICDFENNKKSSIDRIKKVIEKKLKIFIDESNHKIENDRALQCNFIINDITTIKDKYISIAYSWTEKIIFIDKKNKTLESREINSKIQTHEQWFNLNEKSFDSIGDWTYTGGGMIDIGLKYLIHTNPWAILRKEVTSLIPDVSNEFESKEYLLGEINDEKMENYFKRRFTSHIRRRAAGYIRTIRGIDNYLPDLPNENLFYGLSYVYLLQAEIDGEIFTKIGKADHTEVRKNQIEISCGIPHKIIATKAIPNDETPGRMAVQYEQSLHNSYGLKKAFFNKTWDGSNEYFKLDKIEIDTLIETCKFDKYN